MAQHESNPGSGEHHEEFHLVPPKVLISTGAALLVLTVVTVGAAQIDFAEWDLKELNIWIALAIAVFKASLVGLFFMHLRYDRPFNSFVFVASLCFVLLFIGFALTDTVAYDSEVTKGNATDVQAKLAELQLQEPKVE